MPSKKNRCLIHRYQRKKFGKGYVYRCSIEGCPSFIQPELLEGRKCICNRCGNPFIVMSVTLRNCPAKPHCEGCTEHRDTELDKRIDEILGE